MTTIKTRKKLIEVAIPLEVINLASAAEKQPGIGAHPRGLHLYFARRPLAAARAVIFAQMVDDPSANEDLFPTEKAQDEERSRLFKIMEELVKWENITNTDVINAARKEILLSWQRACEDNKNHPQARHLFNEKSLPGFHDPFAGGGALPLEAQRLGLESYATDLNPVSVLINKSMIEIPPKFAGMSPINPLFVKDKSLFVRDWNGSQGLAEDIKYYGKWMREEAYKEIGELYPKVKINLEQLENRPDLIEYKEKELSVIAWIWVRTVKSPNPAFADVDVPLASTFMLSTKEGKEAYIEPIISGNTYRFSVRLGKPADEARVKLGTKLGRGPNFRCLLSGVPIDGAHVKSEAMAGRMGIKLMAVVAEGNRKRLYIAPSCEQEVVALKAKPEWRPELVISGSTQYIGVRLYGMDRFDQLFTSRQLAALGVLSRLVSKVKEKVSSDIVQAGGMIREKGAQRVSESLADYPAAVALYLAFAVNRLADFNSMLSTWKPSGEQVMHTFTGHALKMTWDFPESNVFGTSAICWDNCVKYTAENLASISGTSSAVISQGRATQDDAATQTVSRNKVISTDPPYYDNVPYADLSDFFYVWLRRSLAPIYTELFSTIGVPKAEELVAFAYRHEGKSGAEKFFLDGMTSAMSRLAEQAHPSFPVTIYYAFKQSESDVSGTASTGWEVFLDAVIKAGFSTSGTWPMRTELSNRIRGMDSNALASSIVIVCRRKTHDAPVSTRRDYVAALKDELPIALKHLRRSNIAPVDLAQASIGPGVAVFTRYSRVINAEGMPMSIREALLLINQVLDEQLSEQESAWDADTRWGVAWFDQFGFEPGAFGSADQLARAKNTSVPGIVQAGLVFSSGGMVRLLRPNELPADWSPETDSRLTVWEMLHHLIRLQRQGEAVAAAMLARLGVKADATKELAYRLYGICEKKKRSAEGQLYNDLIVVWTDLLNQSKQAPAPIARPGEFELDA